MPNATIPNPSEDELMIARTSLLTQAERAGLNTTTPAFKQFLADETLVKASLMAEARWMTNIVHASKTE